MQWQHDAAKEESSQVLRTRSIPPRRSSKLVFLCVCAHDVHRRGKHKMTKSRRGRNSLSQRSIRKKKTRSVCAPRPLAMNLRPRRGAPGSLLPSSVPAHGNAGDGDTTIRKLLGSGGGNTTRGGGTLLSHTSPTSLSLRRWRGQQAPFPRVS